jgi:hypothetical protein
VDSASLVIDQGQRVSAHDLMAPQLEMVRFLELASGEGQHPVVTEVTEVVRELFQISGGQLGLSMELLRRLFLHFQTASGTFERSTLSPQGVRQYLFSRECWEGLGAMRSLVQVADAVRTHRDALQALLCDDTEPNISRSAELRKLGILAPQLDGGACVFVSRFIKVFMWQGLFRAPGHMGCSFSGPSDFVRQLLAGLQRRDVLFPARDGSEHMRHEDSVNRRIATQMQRLLPADAVYDGPVTLARGAGLEAQCDHVVHNLCNRETWLLEVLLGGRDLLLHSQRFGASGSYAGYLYNHGIILDLRYSVGTPRPALVCNWMLDSEKSVLFVVYVTQDGFRICAPCDCKNPGRGLQEIAPIVPFSEDGALIPSLLT